MTLEALNLSSFESLPFSLRSICVYAQVSMCVRKSLCGVGTSSVAQWLRLGFQCRCQVWFLVVEVLHVSGYGKKKKSLYDIVFLFPLPSADSSRLLVLSLPCLFIFFSLFSPQPLSLSSVSFKWDMELNSMLYIGAAASWVDMETNTSRLDSCVEVDLQLSHPSTGET